MKQLKVDQTQLEPVILPRTSTGAEPQHLLLALLAEHWFRRGETLPSTALVELLGEFGIGESSARQTMRRLAARDLLVTHRSGRTTSYGFPSRSDTVINARLRAVVGFGQNIPAWDGQWTIVTFSVPEIDRELRRVLRNQLRAMRFGMLQDAFWINPHDHSDKATQMLDELEVGIGHVFRARHIPRKAASQEIRDAFGLDELAAQYREFIAQYQPLSTGNASYDNALVERTRMVNKWLTFRTEDPELPAELLPEDWPRTEAHRVFLAVYDRLGAEAEELFRKIVAKADPELSKLVTHITSDILN